MVERIEERLLLVLVILIDLRRRQVGDVLVRHACLRSNRMVWREIGRMRMAPLSFVPRVPSGAVSRGKSGAASSRYRERRNVRIGVTGIALSAATSVRPVDMAAQRFIFPIALAPILKEPLTPPPGMALE
jgi:hypothetical protein